MFRLATQVHMYVEDRIQNYLVDRKIIYHNSWQGLEIWFPDFLYFKTI